MFKFFVFAAVLAFAFAAPEPKPGFITAAYSAPVVAAHAPFAYSAVAASPYAYTARYVSPYAYSAPYVVG